MSIMNDDFVVAKDHINGPSDPVFQTTEGEWGFWDETWSVALGGCATESDARKRLAAYVETL